MYSSLLSLLCANSIITRIYHKCFLFYSVVKLFKHFCTIIVKVIYGFVSIENFLKLMHKSSNILKLLEALKENTYKLFAFEMKIYLNFSNLREYYFQAVSNSSWAHEGYLVSLNIEEDTQFIDELRRLNNAFGIGIIKLNPEHITQSEILFSAKTKEFLDWNTIDRLVNENSDFECFINDLMEDIKIGKIKSNYDATLKDDDVYSYSKSKLISNR